MPKFTIEHNCQHNAQDTYTKIKGFLETDQDLRRLDSKLNCDFSDGQLSGKAKGSQFKADFKVISNTAGAKVEVVVDLPLLMAPFKGKVEEILTKKLKKVLA